MRAEIITIGDELLIGMTVDTNSAWLGTELTNIGFRVYQITSISDNKEHILKAIDESFNRSELVLVTGGLGPTSDDKIDKETDGLKTVETFLDNTGVNSGIINKVLMIMSNISFRDSYNSDYERTDELNIVQDADRLDAIGAIGIARAFNYGGSRNNEIYIPDQSPGSFTTREEYTGSRTSTINHFYEKLLLLKDMMNTGTGRELAEERHKYLEGFLEQFYREWDVSQR